MQLIQSKPREDGKVPTPKEVAELMKEFALMKCVDAVYLMKENGTVNFEELIQ